MHFSLVRAALPAAVSAGIGAALFAAVVALSIAAVAESARLADAYDGYPRRAR